VLVDYNQNRWGSTLASVYSVRPRPEATVSMPVTWKEVERGDVDPQTLTIRNMAARVDAVGDVWNDMWRRRRSLKPAIEKLKRLKR